MISRSFVKISNEALLSIHVDKYNYIFRSKTPENGYADPIVNSQAVVKLLKCRFVRFFRPDNDLLILL